MNRRQFLATTSAAAASAAFATTLAPHSAAAQPAARKKGVLLMNRIGPSTSNLYVANADGSGERKLLADPTIRRRLAAQGVEPKPLTPDAFAKLIAQDYQAMAKVVKVVGKVE